jgi:hypothetical protein
MGAAANQFLGVFQGVAELEAATTVGEGVGGTVENSHHQWLRTRPQLVDALET